MARQASDTRVQLSRQADHAGQFEGVVRGVKGGRHQGLPLARSAPYVGELARAKRDAAVCLAGDGWLVERGNGTALRAPRRPPLGAFCGPLVCVAGRGIGNSRHNYVTVRKMKGPASLQALDLLVAGTGFEPVTFGL